MGLFRILVIGLFILSIPVTLITTNIRVAISEQKVYDYSVRTYGGSQVTGIPQDELLRADAALHYYLTSDNPAPLSIQVHDSSGELVPLFNSREIAHMADVRTLVRLLFNVQIAAVAAALTLAVVMLLLWPPRALATGSLLGALLTGAVLGLAGIGAMAGFDRLWTDFHLLAFSNNLWQLSPLTDHLIQMFPQPFWERITLALGAFTVLQAALIAAVSSVYLYVSRPLSPEPFVKPVPELPGPAGHTRMAQARPRQFPG